MCSPSCVQMPSNVFRFKYTFVVELIVTIIEFKFIGIFLAPPSSCQMSPSVEVKCVGLRIRLSFFFLYEKTVLEFLYTILKEGGERRRNQPPSFPHTGCPWGWEGGTGPFLLKHKWPDSFRHNNTLVWGHPNVYTLGVPEEKAPEICFLRGWHGVGHWGRWPVGTVDHTHLYLLHVSSM